MHSVNKGMNPLPIFALVFALATAQGYAQDTLVIAPGGVAPSGLAPGLITPGGLAPVQIYLADQAPLPPAPPAPPEPMHFADTIRLMSSSGSYLGVGVRDVDEERKKALKLKEERGAEITSVEEDSPAAKAGLKTSDVVVEYAGQRVESMQQFIRMVRETPAGREVKIGVIRNGSAMTLTARPDHGSNRMAQQMKRLQEAMPQVRAYAVESMPRPVMNWQSVTLGIEAEPLSPQLAEFFGVKQGVLVRSVTSGSLAEQNGIKAGDVITKIDDSEVSSPREITSNLYKARTKGNTVTLTTVREKKEQSVKVTFPEQDVRPGRVVPGARTVKSPLNL
jgi:serine protease Do